MKIDKLEVAAALAPGALLALVGGAVFGAVAATLDPAERAALGAMLAPRGALFFLGWMLAAGALGAWSLRLYAQHVAAPARLAEAVQALSAASVQRELKPQGGAGARALTAAVNELLRQRDAYRDDVQGQVAQAARGIEQERSRLAALMAELTQSVVVCNLDGRILLYNSRARLQFKSLSQAPAVSDGAELIGLGRSVYSVFDRKLVAHALENIQQRLQRGAAQPSAQFVTSSRAGQLLRVQMAPVRDPTATGDDIARLSGFVLMLENITRDFESDSEQDRLLHGLTEGSRSSLGNLQAAVDMLELPDLDAPMRERFLGVVRDEARAMTTRIQELANNTSQSLKTRWPLEEMLGADLVQAALRRIEAQLSVRTAASDVDPNLWLKVDSFAMLQAIASLAARLVAEFDVKLVQLRLQPVEGDAGRAHLDLIWNGQVMSTETVMSWESSPMTVGNEANRLSVGGVVERHGG